MLWQTLSWFAPALGIPAFAIPGFAKIWASLIKITPIDVLVTLARVIGALILSFVLGVALAMAMYRSHSLENHPHPIVRLLMAVPVVCWILFAVLWFKWVELRIAFVLIVVCGPVFIVDVLDGMKGVSRELRDMLRSFRPSQVHFFTKLVLPATLPTILTSWKINLSLAIRVVTMAELVGAVSGIGYGLVVAQELFSVAEVFAWTFILVAILFALEAIVARVERACCGGAHERAGAIEVTGLRKVFRQTRHGQAVVAIDRLDFGLGQGEMVAIVGQTGCGKSTFLNLLIGLDRPTEGRIAVGGRTPYDDFDHFRGVLATVFQQDRLLPWRTSSTTSPCPSSCSVATGASRSSARCAGSPGSASADSSARIRTSSPAACGSAWRSRARSSSSPPSSSPTRPSGISTRSPRRPCARRSSSSRATAATRRCS